jgi:hypothetical protein
MTMSGEGDCFCPGCLKELIEQKKKTRKLSFMSREDMQEHIDYYINEQGYWVFTSHYHIKRGFCCESGCLHCPYGFKRNAGRNK